MQTNGVCLINSNSYNSANVFIISVWHLCCERHALGDCRQCSLLRVDFRSATLALHFTVLRFVFRYFSPFTQAHNAPNCQKRLHLKQTSLALPSNPSALTKTSINVLCQGWRQITVSSRK